MIELIWLSATLQVPKSGELWCEIGRRNALLGNWRVSEQCLLFAAEFTPQVALSLCVLPGLN